MDHADESDNQKQCRICFEGADAEPDSKFIRPCLCKGSMQYVHVHCLQRWRNSSQNRSAFYKCGQCGYDYRLARTRIVNIASNPGFLFTLLSIISSYVTTYTYSYFSGPSSSSFYISSSSYWFYDPTEVLHDLVRASLGILQDEEGIFQSEPLLSREHSADASQTTPGFLARFIQRFVIGLPLIGASSLIHMLVSLPLIGPLHWLARFRARRRNNDRDISALIIAILIVVGAARCSSREVLCASMLIIQLVPGHSMLCINSPNPLPRESCFGLKTQY
ncbi:hypothetical protein D9757_005351 [Collybiopsis confluens]|uniref:RING-CH-type domain-containing protein n=1 Tax=Collybiopsis confluens TaxID=2823264 RepID=A0A8H5HLD3_9AGAR|nr:hypothetical protein D9757_005351 [Collybiopsis confluens]